MSEKNPNPQGKGLSPVLEGLARSRAGVPLPPKQIDQISSELFTSLFVLKSGFRFRPVVGKSYWLYRIDDRFKLLMLPPEQWSAGHPGQFIGECVLQEDITWTLTLDPEAARDETLLRLIEEERRRLEDSLQQADSVGDAMPVYVQSMPFYCRLLAYGLGSSLRGSMQAAGINALTYEQARGLLTHGPSGA
jgi:hypothetical protein